MTMSWGWLKSPPVMQRTLADDLKLALAVLVGSTLAFLLFGDGDASVLLGSVIGVVVVIVVVNVVRRARRRQGS